MQSTSVTQTILYVGLTAMAYCTLAAFLNKYGLVRLGMKGAVLSGVSCMGIFIFVFTEAYVPLTIGLICTASFFVQQLWARRSMRSQ